MDAPAWLGLEPTHNPMRWVLPITPGISTGHQFLFGGCGLGAAIAALEGSSGRPVVWATAQYLSYANPPSIMDIDVTIAVEGKQVTQARAVGHVGDREILTVNAALGVRPLEAGGQWAEMPEVPGPDECERRISRHETTDSIMERIDVRLADARSFEDLPGPPSEGGRSALWARIPDVLDMSAATLAILGDYVPFGIGQALGAMAGGNSLDNTLRVGPARAHGVGAARHPRRPHRQRLRPRRRAPLGRGRHPPRHRQPVDDRPLLEGRAAAKLEHVLVSAPCSDTRGASRSSPEGRRASAGRPCSGWSTRAPRWWPPTSPRTGSPPRPRTPPGPTRSPRSSATSATRRSRPPPWPRALEHGRLDLLVNSAGILRFEHSHEVSLESWQQILDVNLTGTFLMCQAAIPALLEQRGAIVNVSSTAALAAHPWAAAYSASKGGVLALTRTLAIEYAKQGLRANAVCPGSIDTPITDAFTPPRGRRRQARVPDHVAHRHGRRLQGRRRHRLPRIRRRHPRQRRRPPHRRRDALVKFCFSAAFSPASELGALARAGDASGWDTMTIPDHLINPVETRSTYPYTADGGRRWEMGTEWPDPWITIANLAGMTERLRFLTTVYILPARTPVHVAKQVGTAAVLSGGRVELGIGMGWMEEEFDAMGVPFAKRGKRADEMLEVMRKLWTGEVVEHHGEYFDVPPLEMLPAPTAPIAHPRRRHLRGRPAARRPQRRLGERPPHHRGAGRHPSADRAVPRGVRPHPPAVLAVRRRPATRGTSTATAACTRPA